jgi:hypothetical protein
MVRLLFVLSVLLVVRSDVNATLIERDLFSPGDGLLTYDTQSGLEWLDWTYTDYGVSYNDILTSELVSDNGLRYATQQEVCVLAQYGITFTNCGGLQDELGAGEGNQVILDFLGATWDTRASRVVFDDDDDVPGAGVAIIQVLNEIPPRSRTELGPNSQNPTGGVVNIGHGLVRSAIPEPSTLIMIVGGLTGLAAYRRK